jgi:serine/threonine-protein kinase
MTNPDLIPVPGQLGPYRLIRRLGFGGTSQVLLAEVYGASGFAKRVAIKTLLPQYIGDPDHERLFIREATLGANLVHQNLVQIHDFGVQDGIQFMRLDYVDGQNLAEHRGDRALPVAEALFIAREVAQALCYLHTATDGDGRPLGLVHRDLKPGNVLISSAGEVRLADLGIMKATSSAEFTRGGVRRGTYAYMSPEQVAGSELTAASDQFSLGTLIFEMILGEHPFGSGSPTEVLDRIREADATGLDRLPDSARILVEQLLQRDVRNRFASSEELLLAMRTKQGLDSCT